MTHPRTRSQAGRRLWSVQLRGHLLRTRAAAHTGHRHGRVLLGRHRRLVIALLLGAAATLTLHELTTPAVGARVVVTTRALAPGDSLQTATTVVDAPAHAVTKTALSPTDLSGARASHAMAAGDLVAHSDITRVRIPAGQVAIPVPITAGGHAWVRAGDDLLLYPMTTSSSMESGVDDTAFHGVEPIGPVKVLSTTSEEADAVSTGSQAPSILVLVDRDQAPRLAEAAASASFLAALMP